MSSDDGGAERSVWASPSGAASLPGRAAYQADDVADEAPTMRLAVTDLPESVMHDLPRREGLRGTVVVVVATLVGMLGITVLGLTVPAPPDSSADSGDQVAALPWATPTATPSPTVAPTPTGPVVYQVPGDLCQAADFTAFRPTFDELGDLRSSQNVGSGNGGAYAECDGATGNEDVRGAFAFRATVYADPVETKREFDAARKKDEKTEKLASIPGGWPNDSAYLFRDATDTVTVEIADGNLRMRLSWGPVTKDAQPPPFVADVLVQVCQSTMSLLRRD